jgi:hypothetical protein
MLDGGRPLAWPRLILVDPKIGWEMEDWIDVAQIRA